MRSLKLQEPSDEHLGDVTMPTVGYSFGLSLSKVKRLPFGLRLKQVVARRDQCGLSAGVFLFVDGVSRSCQESIPQRVQGEEVSNQN